MLAFLLAAAALQAAPVPKTAADAERAFAADAKANGQWTAFRRWSTPAATMFFPEPAKAHERLKDAQDPPQSVEWTPAASFVSCDGKAAANTGPWRQAAGNGYFSTIWVRQPAGDWKWVVDGGDELATPRAWPAQTTTRAAACTGKPPRLEAISVAGATESGWSPDRTLSWQWTVATDGARRFTVRLWTGAAYETVIEDRIAAPPKPEPKATEPAPPAR